jgi:dTDP-4-dehydrorhamnose reductase
VKLLVTGVHGQLARSLVERAHGRPEFDLLTVGQPDVDLEIAGSAGDAIRRAGPDLVINAAAYTDVDRAEDEPERAFRINSEAAGEVAAAARELAIPVVHISTDYVFDGAAESPYSEEARPNPIGVYGRSKLAGEEAVRAADPDHLVLRTAWVYSPFGRNFVRTMFDLGEQRDEVRVVADQRGSPTSALDLADAILLAAGRWQGGDPLGLGQTYHLGGSGEASWFDVAVQVMAARERLGLRAATVHPIATADWPTRARRPANSMLDSAKFERDFRFQMPAWHVSVAGVVTRLVKQNV